MLKIQETPRSEKVMLRNNFLSTVLEILCYFEALWLQYSIVERLF